MNNTLEMILREDSAFWNYNYPNDVKVTRAESGTVLEIDLPGFKKPEVKIEFDEDYMTVSAKNNKRSYLQEFHIGDIDLEKTIAKLEDGILEIKLFKNVRSVKTVTIT